MSEDNPTTENCANWVRYDMYQDVKEKLAARRGMAYTAKFVTGLPFGLDLPSGVVGQ